MLAMELGWLKPVCGDADAMCVLVRAVVGNIGSYVHVMEVKVVRAERGVHVGLAGAAYGGLLRERAHDRRRGGYGCAGGAARQPGAGGGGGLQRQRHVRRAFCARPRRALAATPQVPQAHLRRRECIDASPFHHAATRM